MKPPPLSRRHRRGLCCGWEGEEERRVRGRIHAHLWWAVISQCSGAPGYLHPEEEKGSGYCQSIEGGGLNLGQPSATQRGSWVLVGVPTAENPLPLPLLLCVSVCVCEMETLTCLPACLPVFIVAAQAAVRGVLLGSGRDSLCLFSSADFTPHGWCV